MKSAACLTIKKPGAMTDRGRKDIVEWLRRQATNLLRHGKRYVDRGNFQARYGYEEGL